MKNTARGVRYRAIDVLSSWEKNRLPLGQVLEQHIPADAFADPRDRQLLLAIVYGVIRWRSYLDWVIEKFSSYPLAKIKNRTLQALRIGIFQLLLTDRIPASAAINETVQALKDMRQPRWLTGFVNGLLRNVDRVRPDIPNPLHEQHGSLLPETALLNHPQWLIARWQSRYGKEESLDICRKNNTPAPVCLRVNSSLTTTSLLLEKLKSKGLQAEVGTYSPLAIKLQDFHGPISSIPGFAEGLFQVQDEAAQLISLLLGALQPGKTYLDGCAGLGGKTCSGAATAVI